MKDHKTTSKLHLRNDVLLIIALLVISALGMLYLFVFRSSGDVVRVTVDGELYGVYSLSTDITVDIITGEDRSGLNKLIIRDGRAHIERATCPDGICSSHRPIFRDGESIVCLPNRVVATVIIASDTDSPDIVS